MSLLHKRRGARQVGHCAISSSHSPLPCGDKVPTSDAMTSSVHQSLHPGCRITGQKRANKWPRSRIGRYSRVVLFLCLVVVQPESTSSYPLSSNESPPAAPISNADDSQLLQQPAHINQQQRYDHDDREDLLPDTLTLPESLRLRRAVAIPSKRWPTTTIPYTFGHMFPARGIRKVVSAVKHFNRHTCIRFVPRTDQEEYVEFQLHATRCQSYTGYFADVLKVQPIYLTSFCMEIRGNIIHELAHLLGFYHEHTRIDRDEYIEIIWENIIPNHLNDFEKLNPDVYDSLGVGYDLGSIMHYQLNAFSINDSLPTIRVKEGVNYTGVVGQRNGLSLLDIKQMEYLYQCGAEASTVSSSTPPTSPTVSQLALQSGNLIALKLSNNSDSRLWVSCTNVSCTLDTCPGNRFKVEKMSACPEFIFTVLKLPASEIDQDDYIRTGDRIVLMDAEGSFCGLDGVCDDLPSCRSEETIFNETQCPEKVLTVKPAILPGSPATLVHKDSVTFQRVLSASSSEAVQCRERKLGLCWRESCHNVDTTNSTCVLTNFDVYKLS